MTNRYQPISCDALQSAVAAAAALGDPNRLRLLAACLEEERCVCQLVGLLGLSNATVSKHLTLLRTAGLIESRKEGRWVHYRLSTPPEDSAQADAMRLARRLAGSSHALQQDRARLDAICDMEPSEVARRVKLGEAVCPPACC